MAELFGKSLVTIDAWVRRGMPVVERGHRTKEWKFDTSLVAEWREKQAVENALANISDVEIEEARRRKLAAEAGILEIELKKKRNDVIDRDEVEKGLTHAYITIKQRLRTIPERIIPQLIGETDEVYASELLLDEIDDALLELSQLDYSFNEESDQEN